MTERDAAQSMQGPFEAPWSVWEGHTCPVAGRPVTLREWALHYVGRHLSRGFTVAMAKTTVHMGEGSACEPGYSLCHGVVTVGGRYGVDKQMAPFVTYPFADLAREIENGPEVEQQVDLFAGVA